MKKKISILLVLVLGMVVEIAKADFIFGIPTKVPNVNTSSREFKPSISADGLSLYFISNRPGGIGGFDIWVATRESSGDLLGRPAGLQPVSDIRHQATLAGLGLTQVSTPPAVG